MRSGTGNNILTNDDLVRLVPSVFSTEPSGKVSEGYRVIPTIDIIDGFRSLGFHPMKAHQSVSRDVANVPHAKHMIRLRMVNSVPLNGIFPEILLVNSHNGMSSYQVSAGMMRLVCLNGLAVGEPHYKRRVRHTGNVIDQVVEGAGEIIEVFPEMISSVREWQGTPTTLEHRATFAREAMALKWDGEELPFEAEKLLLPRRQADLSTDLWTQFNVIQENLLRGGVRYRREDEQGIGHRAKSREVKGVSESMRLNEKLWVLAKSMKERISG